jgi:hypothetical protein
MKHKRWLLLLLTLPFSQLSMAADNEPGKDVEAVTTAVFAAAGNCRSDSLFIRQVVAAKEKGMELSRVMSVTNEDPGLIDLARRAYEDDRPANEQENAFYDACIEEKRQEIHRLL